MVTYSATVVTLSHTGMPVSQAQCGSSRYPPTSYGIQMGRFRGRGDSNQETPDSNR